MKRTTFIFLIVVAFPVFVTAADNGQTGSANMSAVNNGIGAAANAFAGKMYQAECSSDNKMACAQAALSYAQAATNISSLLQSLKSKKAADNGSPDSPNFDSPDIDPPDIDPPDPPGNFEEMEEYLNRNKDMVEAIFGKKPNLSKIYLKELKR